MREIKEWQMVQELYEMIDELETFEQQTFIQDLFDNLDPYMPFLGQQSPAQEKWLYTLYDYYLNENEDAYEDWDE